MTAAAPKMRCTAPTCRRPLTNAKSRERGYGRTCWERIHPPVGRQRATPTLPPVGAGFEDDPDQMELFVIVRVPS